MIVISGYRYDRGSLNCSVHFTVTLAMLKNVNRHMGDISELAQSARAKGTIHWFGIY